MTPTTKPTAPTPMDLDALFAAVDAPEQERAAAEARAREAEQRRRQDALIVPAEAVLARFKPVEEAWAAWKVALPPTDHKLLEAQLPSASRKRSLRRARASTRTWAGSRPGPPRCAGWWPSCKDRCSRPRSSR